MTSTLKSVARGMAVWLADLSPNCREATRLAALATQQSLRWRQRFGLRAHVFLCRFCRRFERQLHQLRARLDDYSGVRSGGVTVSLSGPARERLKAALQQPPDA